MSSRTTRLRYLYDFADALSGHFDVPIEITDADFVRLVFSDHDPSGAPVSRLTTTPAMLATTRGGATASDRLVRHPGIDVLGIPGFTVIPLAGVDGGEAEAYLWLIEIDGPIPEGHVEYMARVATRTFRSLAAVPDDPPEGAQSVREHGLLLDTGLHDFPRGLESIAVERGMVTRTPVYAMSVLARPRDQHYETAARLHAALRGLREQVRETVGPRRTIFASTGSEVVILVVGATMEPGVVAEETERLVAALEDELFRLRARNVARDWSIGVSTLPTEWDSAHTAVWQARRAAAVGFRIAWRSARIDWADASPYLSVSGIAASRLRDSFLTPKLETFLKDEEHADLVSTLNSFLRHAGNVQTVAAEQFLHRGTVYYRLRRIETILGVDLTDGNARLALHLGVLSRTILDSTEDQD